VFDHSSRDTLNKTLLICPKMPVQTFPSDLADPASPSLLRALVVGATGQLGFHLLSQLGSAALPAARRPQSPDWLHLDLEKIAANPTQLDGLLERHNITAVFCAAAATNVDRCESDPARAEAANHLGPLALARAARHIPFVFFSTDYIFDGSCENPGPYSEDAAPNPISTYGRTKFEGEQSILAAHPGALIIRSTTVYGPDPQEKNFLYTLSRLLLEGKTMRVPSDQFATPTYNIDLAAAAVALVDRGCSGVFHISGPDLLSRYDFALAACKILSLPTATLQRITTPELAQAAARPLLGGLASGKLQSILGPHCMRSIQTGIHDWQSSLAKNAI
jgi:dTDP-4-dehydrorhamnose reductase